MESYQQQLSPCSPLFFALSLRLFPLSWYQDAPGSFATLISLCWLTYLYISASWLALWHRSWCFTPGVQYHLEPSHKSLLLDRYKSLCSAWSCLWKGQYLCWVSWQYCCINFFIFFFFNSSVVIPGFIVSVQPQGKYKDSFPNKSAQLIDKECGVTGGVDVLVREYLQLAW